LITSATISAFGPATTIGVPAVLVAVLIGVTVPPPPGARPAAMGGPALLVALDARHPPPVEAAAHTMAR
jgi:hypothetical protein